MIANVEKLTAASHKSLDIVQLDSPSSHHAAFGYKEICNTARLVIVSEEREYLAFLDLHSACSDLSTSAFYALQ